MTNTNNSSKVPFYGYYKAIAKACDCSDTYVKRVLNDDLGKYAGRENELTQKIRAKAAELNNVFKTQKQDL